MPMKPPKPCRWPGCPKLTDGRFCDQHRKADRKAADSRRGTAAQRGYGHRWQKYRINFLAENPLCEGQCREQNRVTAAQVVDHIVPHKGDMELFWDPTNHQALCKQCHDIKTATEDGGFGR